MSPTGDEYRNILFTIPTKEPIPNKVIKGHVIRSQEVPNEGSCRVMCYMEPDCVSINVRPSEGGKYKCELNNATVDENQLTFLENRDTTYYLAIEVKFLVTVNDLTTLDIYRPHTALSKEERITESLSTVYGRPT